jgi:hypothetical protein
MIRYQEEEVEINDMCNFRIHVPTSLSALPQASNPPQQLQEQCDVFLECELMFSDLQVFGGPDKF